MPGPGSGHRPRLWRPLQTDQTHQVVRRGRHGERLPNLPSAHEPRPRQAGHGLHTSEDLFHPFANPLTDSIPPDRPSPPTPRLARRIGGHDLPTPDRHVRDHLLFALLYTVSQSGTYGALDEVRDSAPVGLRTPLFLRRRRASVLRLKSSRRFKRPARWIKYTSSGVTLPRTSCDLRLSWPLTEAQVRRGPAYFGISFASADASAFRFALSVEYCTAMPWCLPLTSRPIRSTARW